MNDVTNETSDGMSLNQMMALSRAFQKSRILLTAYELDVFTVLGDEEKSSRDISDAICADQRGTDRLLNTLCALNVLKKSGDTYTVSEVKSWMKAAGMSFVERNGGVMIGRKE